LLFHQNTVVLNNYLGNFIEALIQNGKLHLKTLSSFEIYHDFGDKWLGMIAFLQLDL